MIVSKAKVLQNSSSVRAKPVSSSTDRFEDKPVSGAVSHDEIRDHAYKLYELRGRTEGYALEDWFAAERYLSARKNRANKVIFR